MGTAIGLGPEHQGVTEERRNLHIWSSLNFHWICQVCICFFIWFFQTLLATLLWLSRVFTAFFLETIFIMTQKKKTSPCTYKIHITWWWMIGQVSTILWYSHPQEPTKLSMKLHISIILKKTNLGGKCKMSNFVKVINHKHWFHPERDDTL